MVHTTFSVVKMEVWSLTYAAWPRPTSTWGCCRVKITRGVYAWEYAGYRLVALDAPRQHHGGVEIFYGCFLHFAVEAHQQHAPNVFSFQLTMGGHFWFIMG